MNRPTGTVTFLFTDIEGSTQLWERHPEWMQRAHKRQEKIIRDAVAAHNGYAYKMIGDAFQIAFATARDALEAAIDAQHALNTESWGDIGAIRVRMALHTGVTEERGDDYVGPVLNRVARLMSAGHGGQILVSDAVQSLVRDRLALGITLLDLGERRLKDLTRAEHVYQVVSPDLPSDFPPLRTLDTLPNNLPIQLTSFIGREKEIAEVKRWLETSRLVTLTGAGGCGKTRLATQVAADLLESFDDGAWFVELAPLADPALVVQVVATTFGLQEGTGRSLETALKDYLREKNLLLVLDNCEHLIQACAQFASMFLNASPHLKILATSREALGVAGETVYRVPSLAVPDPQHLPPIEALSQYDAVRLFIDRAISVHSTFTVNNHNAPAVAQICHRLGGIPLAIELAAARVKIFSAEEIEARLDDRFRLLTGGSRTAMPRQQTLRALIDWSYDLLSEPERVLLSRLSVFAGGWTFDAAETVCSLQNAEGSDGNQPTANHLLPTDILDLLSHLIDKSLVLAEEQDGATRYRMLETIRQYAREKLFELGEGEQVRERHLEFFAKFAEEADAKLNGADQVVWLNRLESEHDNLRAALQWSIESQGLDRTNWDWGLRLAGALGQFWHKHSHWSEGRRWLKETLNTSKDASSSVRANVLNEAGYFAMWQNDHKEAWTFFEQSLALYREQNDKGNIAQVLFRLGISLEDQGDYVRAIQTVEESLNLRQQIGDKSGVSYSLHLLGEIARDQGNYSRARQFLEKSLALSRELADKWEIGLNLGTLAEIALRQGEYELASTLCEESLALWRELGDKRMLGVSTHKLGLAACGKGDQTLARDLLQKALRLLLELRDRYKITQILEGLAKIASAEGNAERAARILGAAEALRQAANLPLPPSERTDYEHDITALRAKLDEAAFSNVWAEGRAMTMEQAVEYALAEQVEPSHPIASAQSHDPNALTPREIEVLRLALAGLSDAKIAEKLVISRRTVNTHLSSTYSKLGVNSRSAATRYALDHKLI